MDMASTTIPSAVIESFGGLSTPLPQYTGFPWWHALLTSPSEERGAAERLQRYDVHAYLPTEARKQRRRGHHHRHVLSPIIVGMMFVPEEMLARPRVHDMLERCGVRDYWRDADGAPRRLGKAVIERIREMEAELNMDLTTRQLVALKFGLGMEVVFIDELLNDLWGTAVISEIDREGRITVDVKALLGRTVPVRVTAAQIETLQPRPAAKPPQAKASHRS